MPEATNRIRRLVEYYADGNVSRFVQKAGIESVQKLNRLFNVDSRSGKYPSPSISILSTIAGSFPQINSSWLLKGEGEMLLGKSIGANEQETGFFAEGNVGSVRPNLKEYYTQVKMLSARAQMGIPSMTHDTFNLTWLEETYPVFMPTIALSNKHLVIEVVGDSMVPEIKDRALVLAEAVNTNDIKYQSGAVFAVLYAGNHFVVKRIKTNELNTNGTLTLWSDNHMYGNIIIHGEDIIHMWRIIEKVKEPVR